MTEGISYAGSETALRAAAKRRGAVLMLLAAAFFWGSDNIANKSVLADLDPFAAAALRNLIAAVALLPFVLRDFAHITNFPVWLRSATLPSVFFDVAVILQQWGYQTATVTNASFLVNAGSLLTPIIAVVVLKERLHLCIGIAASYLCLAQLFSKRVLAQGNHGCGFV